MLLIKEFHHVSTREREPQNHYNIRIVFISLHKEGKIHIVQTLLPLIINKN